MTHQNETISTSELTLDNIKNLLHENCLIYGVRGFAPAAMVEHICAKLESAESSDREFKGGAPINRIGQPYFSTKLSAQHEREYFDNSQAFHDTIDHLCAPYINPIDLLCVKLGKLWPGGAVIGKLGGKLMVAGLIRKIDQAKGLPFHVDANKHGPDGVRGSRLDNAHAYLYANIYLKTDGVSGRLQARRERPGPLAYKAQNDTGFGSNSSRLFPDAEFVPMSGDLALGHADMYHRVTEAWNERVSASCFIAVFGEDEPLVIYS
ncbi:hypothetical protein [Teredinibacter turnerae]|uniref:hypothetical protein n=1 Tax=Teredinibacter turnerae TaxID=2426 RepID=UPI0004215082|nr:hypothetical protein [Teredinibacter turnerae]